MLGRQGRNGRPADVNHVLDACDDEAVEVEDAGGGGGPAGGEEGRVLCVEGEETLGEDVEDGFAGGDVGEGEVVGGIC